MPIIRSRNWWYLARLNRWTRGEMSSCSTFRLLKMISRSLIKHPISSQMTLIDLRRAEWGHKMLFSILCKNYRSSHWVKTRRRSDPTRILNGPICRVPHSSRGSRTCHFEIMLHRTLEIERWMLNQIYHRFSTKKNKETSQNRCRNSSQPTSTKTSPSLLTATSSLRLAVGSPSPR